MVDPHLYVCSLGFVRSLAGREGCTGEVRWEVGGSECCCSSLRRHLPPAACVHQVSVLDKSKMDWQDVKAKDGGLEEELEAHKKSSGTYLEKVGRAKGRAGAWGEPLLCPPHPSLHSRVEHSYHPSLCPPPSFHYIPPPSTLSS